MAVKYKVKTEPELLLFIRSEGKVSVDDVKEFNNFIKGYIEGTVPFKLMIDVRNINKGVSQEIIREIKDSLGYYDTIPVGKVVVIGILISSPIIETIANLIFSLCPPITPIKLSKDSVVICDFINEY